MGKTWYANANGAQHRATDLADAHGAQLCATLQTVDDSASHVSYDANYCTHIILSKEI